MAIPDNDVRSAVSQQQLCYLCIGRWDAWKPWQSGSDANWRTEATTQQLFQHHHPLWLRWAGHPSLWTWTWVGSLMRKIHYTRFPITSS